MQHPCHAEDRQRTGAVSDRVGIVRLRRVYCMAGILRICSVILKKKHPGGLRPQKGEPHGLDGQGDGAKPHHDHHRPVRIFKANCIPAAPDTMGRYITEGKFPFAVGLDGSADGKRKRNFIIFRADAYAWLDAKLHRESIKPLPYRPPET